MKEPQHASFGPAQAPLDKSPVLTWANLNALPEYVEVPKYDRSKVTPSVVHIGPSRFFFAHEAAYLDGVLHDDPTWGVTVCSIRSGENALTLQRSDGLYVVLKYEDGKQTARVIGSIVGSLFANGHPEAIIAKVADASTRLITCTITPAGYYKTPDGNLDLAKSDINHDLTNPETPLTIYPYLVRGLEERARTHGKPVVLMSFDNVENNSATLKRLLLQYIQLTQPSLAAWVEENCRFPVTLVDRITPDINADDRTSAEAFLGGYRPRMLVRTEGFKELVVEKCDLPMPPWDRCGAKIVNDCGPHWTRKYFGLNAAHQIVAIPALRLGIPYIHQAMQRQSIARLVDVAHTEYGGFLDECPEVLGPYLAKVRSRFSDASNPDRPSRVAARTTEKASDRLAAAILRGLEATGQVQYASTFVLAVWALNLGGHDEFGQRIDCQDVLAGKIGDLHRRFLHYARVAAAKESTDQHPVGFLKTIMSEVANVLQDSRFARLAGVDAFVRRLSSALGYIEKLGMEDAVEPYLADA
jgi:mannitol-1-phosphate/altronate dehydrogenase